MSVKNPSKSGAYWPGVAWTPAEDEFLREHAPHQMDRDTAMVLGRSVKSVAWRRVKVLGIHKVSLKEFSWRWTAEELQIIRDNFETLPLDEWAHLLPRHTRTAIWARGDRMGLVLPGRYPKEVRELTRLINKLKRLTNERERESQHH